LGKYNETERKTKLTTMLGEINPGDSDTDKKDRFENINKSLNEKSLID